MSRIGPCSAIFATRSGTTIGIGSYAMEISWTSPGRYSVEALKAHYANGAPPDWQHNFVTPYATADPWEDFAETWAHYLHIVDTLEMAGAFGHAGAAPSR
jgi:hypothetical protein